MAAIQAVAMVGAKTQDGGLHQVMEASKVHTLIAEQIKKEGVEDLSDFSATCTQTKCETEAETFRDKVEELKAAANIIDVARLCKAILMARGVLDRPEPSKEAPAPEPADIESPLTVKDVENMQTAWEGRYVQHHPDDVPGPSGSLGQPLLPGVQVGDTDPDPGRAHQAGPHGQ